ncbi:hypothetical protein WJX77_000293 [Trebouxia sp. C0004]
MVRRKQQNPKALLGPPESRQLDTDVSNGLTAALPAQQSRSRPGGPAVAQKNLTVLTNVRSLDDNLLPLRHLQIDCKNLRTTLTASTQPSLCLSITPKSGELDIAWSVSSATSEDPVILSGTIYAATRLAAEGFISLLHLGRLAVQLVQADQSEHSRLCVSLHTSALEVDQILGEETGGFDVAELYAAVKPEGSEPELAGDNPKLRPTLRPYQKRAAAWMVSREKASQEQAGSRLHPLWREVTALNGRTFYFNPFTGRVSQEHFEAPPSVQGGILSDEMGLGKTVELLACVLANPFMPSNHAQPVQPEPGSNKRQKLQHHGKQDEAKEGEQDEEEEEHIDCVCGVTGDTPGAQLYHGLWLQCDQCLSWLHGACVGFPKRAPKGDFVCGRCTKARASQEMVSECGATLIVCPATILQQWQSEITKHTQPGALKVITYLGQHKTSLESASIKAPAWQDGSLPASVMGNSEDSKGRAGKHSGQGVVSAGDLAGADVVLTTYDVLKRDVHHLADPEQQSKTFRTRKRYEVIPTPLTRLCWWRVCLDEAQMVESSTAKAAEMASKLAAHHRWCITGTPLSRGLEDLYGLFYFLKAAPLSEKFWWNRVCQRPYEAASPAGRARLLTLLKPSRGGLLWRTAKADVAHELGLPPQHQHTSSLQFSAIERHFYSRQHAECSLRASSTISSQLLSQAAQGLVGQRRLTAAEEKKLLFPLLRLRQACCHPQVGAGGIKSLAAAKAPMSMAEILDVLVSKAKLEAEDAQRVLLGALNGLAALMLLEEGAAQTAMAIKTYREALALGEQNKEVIRSDKLQRLHTLHNLALLLKKGMEGLPGVAPTLRDGQLEVEAQSLRDGYLAESVAKLAVAEKEFVDSIQAMGGASDDKGKPGPSAGPVELLDRCLRGDQIATCRLVARWYMRALGRPQQPGVPTGPEPRANTASVGAAVARGGPADWWLGAIDLLVRSPSQGDNVADHIKEQLMERDRYNRLVGQNATSLSRRFTRLHGLQPLLLTELSAMDTARKASLTTLNSLAQHCSNATQAFVDQAGQCGRCRGELGVAGRVCQHCRLDEQFVGWEVRIYSLQTHAMVAGQAVTAEEAIIRAQAAALRQVGRGGLDEQAGSSSQDPSGPEEGAAGTVRRGDATAVSTAEIVRHPSETEQVLRILATHLRALKHLSAQAAAVREVLVAQSKAHLDLLEGQRKLFLRSRALSLAQRALLYAHDELDMSMMRMQLRSAHDVVKPHEQHFRLQPFEVPLKNRELTNDRLVSEADLARLLGTLRYLQGLKLARQKVEVGAAVDAKAAEAAADHSAASTSHGMGSCPVCHDPLGSELVMLPCGHQLCCRCSMTIIDRAPHTSSPQCKKIRCPTCRAGTKVTDVAYVDNGRGYPEGEEGQVSSSAAKEAALHVEGSYGTKLEAVVRRIKHLMHQDAAAKVLVFSSWQDVLELVSHALQTNKMPYAYARGRKAFDAAVADFKQTNSSQSQAVQILLLLVKQGANGLNLTEAQHVILTEPLVDPSVEAQAVGRVHRIGQTQPTYVHRFVIEATVEENVQRLSGQRAAATDPSAAVGSRVKQVGQRELLTVRDVALLLQQNWTEAVSGHV